MWCIIIHKTPFYCAIGVRRLRRKYEQTSCLEMSSPMNESSGSSHTKSGLCFATSMRTALANSSPDWTDSVAITRRPSRALKASSERLIHNPAKSITFPQRLLRRFRLARSATSTAVQDGCQTWCGRVPSSSTSACTVATCRCQIDHRKGRSRLCKANDCRGCCPDRFQRQIQPTHSARFDHQLLWPESERRSPAKILRRCSAPTTPAENQT